MITVLVLLVGAIGGVAAARSGSPSAQAAEPGGTTTGAAAVADAACAGTHWVTSWMTAPQDASEPFVDQTLRAVVRSTVAGDAVRVTLANRFGSATTTFDDVHVGRSLDGAAVDGTTVRAVTFGGSPAVDVPAGEQVTSDPVDLAVAAGEELTVSYHVVGSAPLDRHLQAIQTSYATEPGTGRHGADATGAPFSQVHTSWYGLVALDVETGRATGAVAVLGDSITEGVGSTLDAHRRWTDVLADRLGGRTAVLNAGIGGNHVGRAFAMPTEAGPVSFGAGAAERLEADVLRRSGVTDLIVFAGINDVFTQVAGEGRVLDEVTVAYQAIAERSRAAGLRVIGATITPAAQVGVKEADRQAVNGWIRTSGVFDAVLDLDPVVADPGDASALQPAYDRDRVHLTDAGYAALGSAVDESLLQGTGCPARLRR